MDRKDLAGLMAQYDDGDLRVCVEGFIRGTDSDGDDMNWSLESVETALHDLEADITSLRKVIAWAKLAPMYEEQQ